MNAYFNTPERIHSLFATCTLWVGTPFHPHGDVCQGGVDCVQLAAKVYIATGVLHSFTPPPYSMDGGRHNDTSAVIEYVQASGRFAEVKDRKRLIAGDLLCFTVGRVVHHVGIYLVEGKFIHAIERYGVRSSCVEDPTWSKRLTVVYRPICA